MRIVREPAADAVVLSVMGTLGSQDYGDEACGVVAALTRQWLAGSRVLVLDLSLAVLDQAWQFTAAVSEGLRLGGGWPHCEIHVAASSPTTYEQLRDAGLPRYLPLHASYREAVTAASSESRDRWRHRDLPATDVSPRVARRELERVCRAVGQDGVIPDAALVLSELATNAVRHASGLIGLSLTADCHRVEMAVTDTNPGDPRRQHPSYLAEHGRGLVLVDAIAQTWGVRHIHDGGKTIWATVTSTP